jgi:S1-C subfamily serine protease
MNRQALAILSILLGSAIGCGEVSAQQDFPAEAPQVTGSDSLRVGIIGRYFDRVELAHLFHLDLDGALLVERVLPNSPAARAGLRGGFVPVRIGGEEILLGGDLIVTMGAPSCTGPCLLEITRVDSLTWLPVTYLRGSKGMTAVIKLGKPRR